MISITITTDIVRWNEYILIPHYRLYIVITGYLMKISDDFTVKIIPIQLKEPVFVYKADVYNSCTTITDDVQLDTVTREEPFTI